MDEPDGNRSGPIREALTALVGSLGRDAHGDRDRRSGRATPLWSVVRALVERNGGIMNWKVLLGIVIVGVLAVLGFLAYRMLMVQMIMGMSN